MADGTETELGKDTIVAALKRVGIEPDTVGPTNRVELTEKYCEGKDNGFIAGAVDGDLLWEVPASRWFAVIWFRKWTTVEGRTEAQKTTAIGAALVKFGAARQWFYTGYPVTERDGDLMLHARNVPGEVSLLVDPEPPHR
jgi:hypothetical protein